MSELQQKMIEVFGLEHLLNTSNLLLMNLGNEEVMKLRNWFDEQGIKGKGRWEMMKEAHYKLRREMLGDE